MSIWDQRLKHPIDFIESEDASFLLLESGDKIILEQTGKDESAWINRTPKH